MMMQKHISRKSGRACKTKDILFSRKGAKEAKSAKKIVCEPLCLRVFVVQGVSRNERRGAATQRKIPL
jgi:hypothetical protein